MCCLHRWQRTPHVRLYRMTWEEYKSNMRLETRRASGNAEPTLQNSGSSAARFVMGLLEKRVWIGQVWWAIVRWGRRKRIGLKNSILSPMGGRLYQTLVKGRCMRTGLGSINSNNSDWYQGCQLQICAYCWDFWCIFCNFVWCICLLFCLEKKKIRLAKDPGNLHPIPSHPHQRSWKWSIRINYYVTQDDNPSTQIPVDLPLVRCDRWF